VNDSISKALHALTSISQMFHSYEQLLQNLNFHIQPKKMQEICHRGALKCREIRQIVLVTMSEENPPGDTNSKVTITTNTK